MRIAYLDCFSGISGDMFLGALVDAGVPLELLDSAAQALNVGVRLEARKVVRGGLTGTKVDVLAGDASAAPTQSHSHNHSHTHAHRHDGVTHTHEHSHPHTHTHAEAHDHAHAHKHQHDRAHPHEPSQEAVPAPVHEHEGHRSLSTILGIIDAAPLSPAVKQYATRAFQLLGEAEAGIHSIPIDRVHFHEVGAVDTIVDIVCAAAGAEHLGVDRWFASPLNVGSGTVQCAHGTLPVPAPATLALIGNAPMYAAGPPMERVTPTGAAILRMLEASYGVLPAVRASSTGYGAGGRDTPGQPNLLRMIVGELGAENAVDPGTEQIAILETVVDDSTPQLIAWVSEQLLHAGAWDVYRIPVQMKKGRSGVQITVLCHPERLSALRDLLFRETTTIGVHWRIENKLALPREFAEVVTPWGPVRIKIARDTAGAVSNALPEYEDCRRIAEQHHIPLKQVMLEASRVYSASADGSPQPS
ncbi:nickel pincer cofactor biosynthesis protein LarC [Acidobacteria bacterium AB60]|nr:nickel pincer cofactor biosynthesis protein LarC [Acidobacteria bacterium AB60]